MNSRDKAILLGIAIDRKALDELVADSLAAVDGTAARMVFACANPHSVVVAQRDPLFRAALNHASAVVADGVGVTLMGRLAKVDAGPRITGCDYFLAVMRALERRGGGRVFFLGSTPQTLGLIAARMARDFPALTLCGVCSPPFGAWSDAENAAMLEQIAAARPDVLWVGMTAPRQEKWVESNRARLNVPVIGSVGAVFDFYAGTRPRAPRWMVRMGLEWAYRLAREPGRLWRRNFISSPVFVALVVWRHVLGLGVKF